MGGLTGPEMLGLAGNGELKISLQDKDEFLPLMLVGNRFMGLFGFDGDHKGPEVIVLCARTEGLIGVVLGALGKCLCPYIPYQGLVFPAEESGRINFQGPCKSKEKTDRRGHIILFHLFQEFRGLSRGAGKGLQGPVLGFPKLSHLGPETLTCPGILGILQGIRQLPHGGLLYLVHKRGEKGLGIRYNPVISHLKNGGILITVYGDNGIRLRDSRCVLHRPGSPYGNE